MREDGQYAAVRIFDTSDAETIAAQLWALAARINGKSVDFGGSFNSRRR